MNNNPRSLEELYAALEYRAKAQLQLASYCEKLSVFGAGGVAGGITVAAAFASKTGHIVAYSGLVQAIVCMGITTAGAMILNLLSAMSAYLDSGLTAIARLDLDDIHAATAKRESSKFPRLRRLLVRFGAERNATSALLRRSLIAAILGIVLLNGFVQYVIFALANIRALPH